MCTKVKPQNENPVWGHRPDDKAEETEAGGLGGPGQWKQQSEVLFQPGTVTHIFNPSIQDAEANSSL